MTRSRATLALATLAVATLLVAGPAAAQEPMITVEPSADLADGDTLTVTVAGFPASSETFVSGQCVTPIEDPLQQCDVANIVPVPLDANGGATFEITVKVGPIGTGSCGPDADDCVILVGSLTEPENAASPISFAEQAGDGTPQKLGAADVAVRPTGTWRSPDGTEIGPVDVKPAANYPAEGLFLRPVTVEVRADG